MDKTLNKANELLTWISETYGNPQTLYKLAAQLATIQLDRPFSAQDMTRMEACIWQARLALRPDLVGTFSDIAGLAALSATLSTEKFERLAPNARIEEALDDVGRKIAQNFAPRMPQITDTDSPL